jgi:hypothetical protein
MRIIKFSILIFFMCFLINACQKEKISVPNYLIGEWKNIDGLEQIRLIIENNGKIVLMRSAERGFSFKVKKIEKTTIFSIVNFSFYDSKKSYNDGNNVKFSISHKIDNFDTIRFNSGVFIDSNYHVPAEIGLSKGFIKIK